MTGQTCPVPYIGGPVHMIYRVAFTPGGCACGMAVDTVPAVWHKTRLSADIQQGGQLRVAPHACLILAVDGITVFRVA